MTKTDDTVIFEVNLNSLLEAGITINQYFFLQLSKIGKVDNYRLYLEQFTQPIKKDDIIYLIQKGLLITKDRTDRYTFENLEPTDLFKRLFDPDIPNAIEELIATYPKKTPMGRRLQSDGHKWKPNYLKIIKSRPALHELIIKCIKAENALRTKTGHLEFWPLLTTYINNRRWEDYEDEIDDFSEEDKFSKDI